MEGYHPLTQQWLEIPFLYKPGDVGKAPPTNFPHQPRLDWQMWFAALGTYDHNAWYVHLVYKLLRGDSTEVLSLLDSKNYPFHETPPQAIRSILYEYDFTRLNTSWNRNLPFAQIVSGDDMPSSPSPWWQRKRIVREYLVSLDLANPSLKQFLEGNGISLRPSLSLPELETDCLNKGSGSGATTLSRQSLHQLVCHSVFKSRRFFELSSIWNVLWAVLLLIAIDFVWKRTQRRSSNRRGVTQRSGARGE
jgi:hypothetical protein